MTNACPSVATGAAVIPLADAPRLSPLGLDPGLERAYRVLLERPSWTAAELAGRLGTEPARAARLTERLLGLGLVCPGDVATGRLRPINPQVGLAALLAEREAELARAGRELDSSRLAAADIAVEFAGQHGVAAGVDTARSPAAVRSTLEALVRTASTEIVALFASGTVGVDPISPVTHVDPRTVRPGVRCRAVFPDSARVDPTLSRRLLQFARDGGVIRTGASVPVHAIVVDGTVLAMPADGHGRSGVSVLRLAGAVTATLDLFERIWQAGTPLKLSAAPAVSGLALRERELLALLADGATDESAALRLGISVRTVRRMVSDVMGRLGARSRFQAGMKAADRGWFER